MERGGRGKRHGKGRRESEYTLVFPISDGLFGPSEIAILGEEGKPMSNGCHSLWVHSVLLGGTVRT